MKKVFEDQYEVAHMSASNGEIFARGPTISRPSRPYVPEPKEKASAGHLTVNPELRTDGMAKQMWHLVVFVHTIPLSLVFKLVCDCTDVLYVFLSNDVLF